MKLTPQHVLFYREHKVTTPRWAGAIRYAPSVDINDLINVQVKEPRRLEASNLIHLIRLKLHNGQSLWAALAETAMFEHPTNSHRRRGYARKWLLKLIASANSLLTVPAENDDELRITSKN